MELSNSTLENTNGSAFLLEKQLSEGSLVGKQELFEQVNWKGVWKETTVSEQQRKENERKEDGEVGDVEKERERESDKNVCVCVCVCVCV